MKMQSIYGVILTAVVVTLLVVTVIIPISQTSSNVSYETADNTGYDYLMSKGTSSYSATFEYVSAGTLKVNGTNVTVTGDDTRAWVSDGGIIYLTASGAQVMNVGRTGSVASMAFGSETAQVATASFSAGTFTTTLGSGTAFTHAYSYVLYPDTNGDWGYFSGNAFRISEGAHFYALGTATLRLASGYGTATSMSQAASMAGYPTTWTVTSTAQETYSAVSGVTATAADTSQSNPQNTVTVVGSIAPVEYNAAVQQDSITITDTIVSIIPVVLIVGVIVMAVSYVIRRND